MAKVLMPIGDGTEVMDTLYAYFRLPEDGFEVVLAGPEARVYHGVMHEIPPEERIPWDITREQAAYHIKATVAFRDVDATQYSGLFLTHAAFPVLL
jgi:protease I